MKLCHICRMDITGMEYGVDHWHEPLAKDWRNKQGPDTTEDKKEVIDLSVARGLYLASLIKETGNG